MVTISSEEAVKRPNYIAFFDLDHTITNTISGKVLARKAYKKGLMTNGEALKAVLLSVSYKLGIRDPYKIMMSMTLWLKGLPVEVLNDVCNESVHHDIIPSIYPGARSEIDYHKKNNASAVILSSSILPLCREIALIMGMDDTICTVPESYAGCYTGRTVGKICYGDEKAERLLEYCERTHANPADAWYYGDSVSDLPALNIVGHPVCVNPDRSLIKITAEKGWKILNWESV